ncbi:hypothetical protein [Streptomyces sp. NPDC096012]|uniref:hypothetical protein n=1 Tax=Streptomyces sp. NPDC096012 TaxID=3155684 RepID=UPI00336A230A
MGAVVEGAARALVAGRVRSTGSTRLSGPEPPPAAATRAEAVVARRAARGAAITRVFDR